MRRLLYIIIVGALFFVPLERVNVGDLAPVSAIAIREMNGTIELQVDVGYRGVGESVTEAVASMMGTATSVIYLATAEYLLVPPESTHLVEELRSYVKASVKVFVADLWPDIDEQVAYLNIHGKGVRMRNWER